MAPLRAGGDSQALLLGQLAGLDHRLHARRVDRPGLLHEHVFARLNGRLEVRRPEMRRGGQDHVVDLADGQELLMGIEARETHLLRNLQPQLVELLLAMREPIVEQVRQG